VPRADALRGRRHDAGAERGHRPAGSYKLPFADGSVDVVLSSSCFEHSEFFWLLFLEILRVLRPEGLFYLNAPSNGPFHRYPVDCWRFYPDSGNALV
jgi:SAM-dependent methyltransferase